MPCQYNGLLALGVNGKWASAEDFALKRTVERGPAFGQVVATADGAEDWPTYRHDVERGSGTNATAPDNLKEAWTVELTSPEGPLTNAWKPQLTSPLTAPVVSHGIVFVAAADRGELFA